MTQPETCVAIITLDQPDIQCQFPRTETSLYCLLHRNKHRIEDYTPPILGQKVEIQKTIKKKSKIFIVTKECSIETYKPPTPPKLRGKNKFLEKTEGFVIDQLSKFDDEIVLAMKFIENNEAYKKFIKENMGPAQDYRKCVNEHDQNMTELSSLHKYQLFSYINAAGEIEGMDIVTLKDVIESLDEKTRERGQSVLDFFYI